ncbi:MAG: UDP-3-O-acyl-N-acetylglucosamine deacetylase [Planctomycetes bacterium]|nr:UDP-3-O-acyl-N-acetylglucosamine deacetylase [Planctomycetota bacterium]
MTSNHKLQTIDDPKLTEDLFSWAESLPRDPANQQTLAKETDWLSYIEAHSGAPTSVKIVPARPGQGIHFTDETLRDPIPAIFDTVDTKALCVCVERHGLHVNNVEHLLATLYVFGVDNATVLVKKGGLWPRFVWKRSLPLFTNSVLEYVIALREAEITEQTDSPRKYRTIKGRHTFRHDLREDQITIEPLNVDREPPSSADQSASPESGLRVHYRSGYPRLDIPDQEIEIDMTPATFLGEIAEARTLVNQFNRWPYFAARQLGKLSFLTYGYGVGVNTENAVVRLRNRCFSQPRYGGDQHELVRHKVIDFLAAVRFLGPLRCVKFDVVKSGHAFDLQVCREMDRLLVEA